MALALREQENPARPDAIEEYLRDRLGQRVRVRFKRGYREKGPLKSTTVHQEFRVLRAHVEHSGPQELLAANPCLGVEFPVAVKGLFRPHYVTWSEQERAESGISAQCRADH
jgi:hypothetical protein